MKKAFFASLIFVVISLSIFVGCDSDSAKKVIVFETLAPGQRSTARPMATEEIETTPSATPVATVSLAPYSTYVPLSTVKPTIKPTATPSPTPGLKATPVPKMDTFIDVWAEEQMFVVKNTKTVLDLPGKVTEWYFANTDINYDWTVEDGKLNITCEDTGSLIIYNSAGKRITLFCNEAVEQTVGRKVKEGYLYYLYFEKGSHTMTIYTADSMGYYTVPIRCFCSASGSTPAKTPIGTYTLGAKERWHTFSAKCYAQYAINYASGVYLHSPCYESKKESMILSSYYNSIGENSTGGCLRMQTAYIYWIYMNCDSGTKIEIVDGTPRGTTSLVPYDISNSACFDPTDPILKK